MRVIQVTNNPKVVGSNPTPATNPTINAAWSISFNIYKSFLGSGRLHGSAAVVRLPAFRISSLFSLLNVSLRSAGLDEPFVALRR